jgi:hypothetical protein
MKMSRVSQLECISTKRMNAKFRILRGRKEESWVIIMAKHLEAQRAVMMRKSGNEICLASVQECQGRCRFLLIFCSPDRFQCFIKSDVH